MNEQNYQPVIGLEVHVELKTKSKMFCSCSSQYFGQEPNTHTCPVCLGLPGALPVPNRTAIEWCLKIGIALNCEIPLFSKFDRKNYFYPDLAKGYQISQYDQPFAINGSLELKTQNSKLKTIRIRRVHMEEDTAKLLHANVNGEKVSLIDFNRSGVPLVEIVTEPDFESAEEVVEYLKKLQQIVRYLEVSNADMEKGEMRLEPNISLRELKTQNSKLKTDLPKYKVEIKNINSFRFVDKAISYELKRQEEILLRGSTPHQETRGWDEKSSTTRPQRSKEEAHDYRYFPEPDIPPIRWTEKKVSELRAQVPELTDKKRERFKSEYQLNDYDSEILTREPYLADFFEKAVGVGKDHNVSPKQIANTIINKKTDVNKTLPAEIVLKIVQASQKSQIDPMVLEKIIQGVLKENEKAVQDYKKGKTQVLGFLIGKVKQRYKNGDTNQIKKTLETSIQNT